MNKKEARIHFKEIRKNLSAQRREIAEEMLFADLCLKCQSYRHVLSFMPLPEEIDMNRLNQFLLKHEKLLLPRVEKNYLVPYKLQSFTHLIKNSWGGLEPDPDVSLKVSMQDIDLILVPGLAFDSSLNRLGYGMGFYDRLLEQAGSVCKIGIGFLEQKIVGLLPIESHDRPVDEILLF